MFEGPVPNKNPIESVATSYISERKDYSNSEGRRLLAHIFNSSNESNDAESTFVAGRSQDSRGWETDRCWHYTPSLVRRSQKPRIDFIVTNK